MKKITCTYLLSLVSICLFGQSRTLIGYEMATGITDTLSDVFIPNVVCDKSEYYIGDFNQSIGNLPTELDTSILFHGSQWTYKKPVHDAFDANDFPFRTSAKVFSIEEDALVLNCSGSMVGPNHFLTAAHCATVNNINFLFDSILVCPAYDNGTMSGLFECSLVKKIYVFEEWDFWGEDFAIFELEKHLGQQTGWISIGFDEELKYKDSLLHKFSYPNWGNAPFDPVVFNGDTLYHSYGYADFFDEDNIGFTGMVGVPGESGSSVIHIVNGEEYTSYGVGTWVEDFKHSRMQKEYFYPICEILKREFIDSKEAPNPTIDWTIYPNPTAHQISFSSAEISNEKLLIRVHDMEGKLLIKERKLQDETMDVSFLPKGMYLIRLSGKNLEKVFKFLKTEP